jgi:hypothetical protein
MGFVPLTELGVARGSNPLSSQPKKLGWMA